MSLYAFCIACGRMKASTSSSNESAPITTTDQSAEGRLWLSKLIDYNRKHIFPPEWFGDSIEILETEIQNSLEGKKSEIFSPEAYHKLLRARQELCRLQNADLPTHVLDTFGEQIAAVAFAADKASQFIPPGDAGKTAAGRRAAARAERESREAKEAKEGQRSYSEVEVLPTMPSSNLVQDVVPDEERGFRRGDRVLPNNPTQQP